MDAVSAHDGFDVAIIGAGFGAPSVAIQLTEDNPDLRFVIRLLLGPRPEAQDALIAQIDRRMPPRFGCKVAARAVIWNRAAETRPTPTAGR